MSLSKYNKGGIKWNVTIPENCGFLKLGDVEGGVVRGFFPVKGNYGKQYVMIASSPNDPEKVILIDLPKHMVEVCAEICEDKEAIEDINNLRCTFHVEEYFSRKHGNKKCYGVVFD